MRSFAGMGLLLYLWAGISLSQATPNFWTGGSDNDWFNPNNWSLTQVPQAGQEVVIDTSYVTSYTNILLTNSSALLSSLEITNRMLTFSNWNTLLSATTVTIRSAATLTLPPAFPNGAMSNRIYISCSNFTLETGGRIDVNAKGFAGCYQVAQGVGHGPGGGGMASGWGSGGGHGGQGGYPQSGSPARGAINGTFLNPNTGSGGGGGTDYGIGGNGGGLVRIDATGTLLLNGLITANGGGASGYPSGGGSGGGVRLECWRVDTSSTGTIQAIGGDGGAPGDRRGGRGSGGRIVIKYDPQGQRSLGIPSIRLAVGGATAGAASYVAEIGTIYIPDDQFMLTPLLGTNAMIYGVTNWTVSSLTFTNCSWTLCGPSVYIRVTNTLQVGSSGYLGLHLENSRLDCTDMILTNGGRLAIYSGPTNAATTNYGALVSVTNTVWIGSNSWLYPYSDTTNGGSICFRVNNFILGNTNGGVDANGTGFAPLKGYGTGATDASGYGGGAGYGGKGGKGGNSSPSGGAPYGPTNAPRHPGSGAGGGYGVPTGTGGGLIWIEALSQVQATGILRANGAIGTSSGNGGGSGGGIYIFTANFSGLTNSILEAKGGNGQANGGGGGGGRIGIWVGISASRRAQIQAGNYTSVIVSNVCPTYAGAISVTNGTGYYNGPPNGAEPGTCWFIISEPPTGIMVQIQ